MGIWVCNPYYYNSALEQQNDMHNDNYNHSHNPDIWLRSTDLEHQ